MNTGTGSAFVAGDVQIIYSPDRLDDLLDLVDVMCKRKIAMDEFRERFVMGFLSRTYGEPLDSITMAIEDGFVDFDPKGALTLEQLQDRIFIIAGVVEAVQGKRLPADRRFMRVTKCASSKEWDLSGT